VADPIEKAVRARVILVEGDESALRAEALQKLLSHLQVTPDDFDLEQINADERPIESWISSVCTIPFLAERRILVVRHVARVTPDSNAKGQNLNLPKGELAKLPASSLLILVADDETGDEDRLRKFGTVVTAWRNRLKAEGGEVLSFKADPNAAGQMLKTYFQSQNVTISRQALDTLIEMCGGNYSRALGEAEKLALYAPPQSQITEAMVTDLVVASREWNVFKMIDGIVGNQPAAALRQLTTLIGGSPKSEDQAFRTILPMMSRQLRLLWQARAVRDANYRPDDLPAEFEKWLPEKPNFAKEAPYRQRDLMRLADKITLPRLARAMRVLAETDGRLKGQGASLSVTDTVERMVIEMVATLHPPVKAEA
jgi:DNA polymerase-3 subunit delta